VPEPTVLQLGPLGSIHLRQWAENAAANGYRVHMGGFGATAAPIDFGDAVEAVHVGPDARPPFTTLVWVRWLRGLVERLRPAVIHAHHPPVFGFYAALARVRPLVVSAWGSDVYFAGRRAQLLSKPALRRADRLIAPTRHLIETMVARGADPSRCEEIDLGVDVDRFSPEGEADAGGDGPVVFSFRGGLPVYNIPVLVEGFARVRRRVPNARLVVATGAAALAAEVRTALDRPDIEGALTVLGDVPHAEMPRHFRAADVGVSVPSSDGGPRSVWEALACGLPLVLSDLPQLRDRLGDRSGADFVPVEPDAIATALERLLESEARRRSMAQAGREWAVAHVDRREHVARLGRLYAELSGGLAAPGPQVGS
jgi:L-malate glycosyltransferase